MWWNNQYFDQIYYRYHKSVYYNIRKYIKDDMVAEDLLQEVFATLWDYRTRLDNPEEIGGWLFVVSSRKAISYLKEHMKKSLVLHADVATLPDSYDTEEEKVASDTVSYQWKILQEAIDSLPEQRKVAYRLCRIDGCSYQDAANKMGISLESVKDYIKKANKSIKIYVDTKYHVDHINISTALIFLYFVQHP